MGIAGSDRFEVFSDTDDRSRKVDNLRHNPKIALVIGGANVGMSAPSSTRGSGAPPGAELRRLNDLYFASFPDRRARETWSGITYIGGTRSLDAYAHVFDWGRGLATTPTGSQKVPLTDATPNAWFAKRAGRP